MLVCKTCSGAGNHQWLFARSCCFDGAHRLTSCQFWFCFVASGMVISLFKSQFPPYGSNSFGLGWFFSGATTFTNANILVAIFAMTDLLASSGLKMILVSTIVGILLAVLFDSSLVISLLALELTRKGMLSESASLIIVVASLFGMGIKANFYTRKKSIFARRMSFSTAIIGLVLLLTGIIVAHLVELPKGPLFLGTMIIFSLSISGFLLFFIGPLNRLSVIQIPDDPINEQYKLTLMGKASDMVPVTALQESYLQVLKQFDVVGRLFRMSREFLEHPSETGPRKLAKIKDYERIIDNIAEEVHLYLKHLMQSHCLRSCFFVFFSSHDFEGVGGGC